MYRVGESCTVPSAQVEDYMCMGWYTSPVCHIYHPNGAEKTIYTSELSLYEAIGWADELFVPLYDANGREQMVMQSQVAKYLSEGWQEIRPDWEGLLLLKTRLESYLAGKGAWGVFVQNLKNSEFLAIREERYSAASLIKLYTMASVFSQIEQGNLAYSTHVQRLLEEMICYSSNEAANALTILSGGGTESIGFDHDNATAAALGCTNTGRGSYLVEESGRKGPYRHHNYTSPRDCGRLLKAIYDKTLVSEAASEKMLSLLLSQTRTWKIPAALPAGTKTANKTGETSAANHDAAIVFSPGGDYILCVLGTGGVGVIHEVSRIVYQYFNESETGEENP